MKDPALSAPPAAPSSPAYGGIIALTVIIAAAIVLTYTLLPLPGQREMGAWNYVAAVFFLAITTIMTKRFRPALHHAEDMQAKPRVKQRR